VGPGLYVESFIRGDVEDIWEKTQDPSQHRRWDLRFTEIEYLPRPDPGQPQRFLYATRIGFGLSIRGTGESTGATEKDGTRTSGLRFASNDPMSLIRDGSGYWKYVPASGGTRFLTWYDYRPRFGTFGRFLDLFFRPLIGWATALGFDRLRLWVERGVPPESSMRAWWIHGLSRVALAAIFLYQGLVPKVLFHHPDELAMMRAGGVPETVSSAALSILGLGEVAYGILLVAGWRWRWPLAMIVPTMVAVALGVAWTAPTYLVSAFNVVTLNVAVMALALVALVAAQDAPSASRCLRHRPAGDSA
jgi:hypothetical protein